MAGVTVVASVGNSGPKPGSVLNVAPWLFTVGASTLDREFASYVVLGNKKRIKGLSLSSEELPSGKFYRLISASTAKAPSASSSDAALCKVGTLDHKKVKGKILVCLEGEIDRIEKGHQAALAGAVGMILADAKEIGNEAIADPHLLPASNINFTDGKTVFAYIKSSKISKARIFTKTVLGINLAPVMATFSSRGPNPIDPAILKPDITAPGVDIIVAFSEGVSPTGLDYNNRRPPFITMSGTSMSCPHVTGIVGLLKTLYPKWTPAAIRFAIMTTARPAGDKMLDQEKHETNPFAYGAGHVRPNEAIDPGLVYDLDTNDYLNFLCARGYKKGCIKFMTNKLYKCPESFSLGDLNYPSVSVPDLKGKSVIKRTVMNVGGPATYKAIVTKPEGISVTVSPNTLKFGKIGQKKTFKVVFKAERCSLELQNNNTVFGVLIWYDGKHSVRKQK